MKCEKCFSELMFVGVYGRTLEFALIRNGMQDQEKAKDADCYICCNPNCENFNIEVFDSKLKL